MLIIKSKVSNDEVINRSTALRGVAELTGGGVSVQATTVSDESRETYDTTMASLSNEPDSWDASKNFLGSKNVTNTVTDFPSGMVLGEAIGGAIVT